jgi:hypothetical protein
LYGTGKIGFWSLTEEGIGIIAGSLPALRPLLSLRIRITAGSSNPATSGNAFGSNSKVLQPRSAIKMDNFQTLGGDEVDNSDADSQRKIMKETRYTVTSSSVPNRQPSVEGQWNDKHSTYL